MLFHLSEKFHSNLLSLLDGTANCSREREESFSSATLFPSACSRNIIYESLK